MDVQEFKRRAVAVFERGFGEGDLSVVDEAVAPEGVDRHPFGPDEPDMVAHLKGAITMFRASFPDLQPRVEQVIAEGDLLACRVVMTGSHTGAPFLGVPAQGRPISVEQFHFVRFDPETGRGQVHWANVGLAELMQQLAAPAA
ncbi:MAG: ester cyclase [Candidatus Nanopelagicales bacterium]